MDDTEHFLSLYFCFGNKRKQFVSTLAHFNYSADAVFSASTEELIAAGLTTELVGRIQSRTETYSAACLDWLEHPAHNVLRFDSDHYPKLLKEIPDFPPLLFADGNIALLDTPQIAIVGSRLCTTAGSRQARSFAEALANYGFTVTSGLAQGIDTAAHLGALDSSGNTIAVLGTGTDRIYPASNRRLAEDIVANGLILSEFPPGTGPAKHHFPRRNRIISGLSVAIVVVEASLRSGSLITARLGSEQGRDVFALPGSVHSPQARGCHQLIRNGAILVENPQQIVEELGHMLGYLHETQTAAEQSGQPLEVEEVSLMKYINYDPITVDSLCELSGLTIDKLSSILLALELKRIVESVPGGRIVRI